MTRERDFDQVAKAWLDLGPNRAPDRVVAAVLRATESTPQVRRRGRLPTWRPVVVGAVAALAIVIVGGALYVIERNQPSVSGPGPSPSVLPSPSVTPSPSAPPPSEVPIVLQRSPTNLGCDSLPSGWRSATIHIDPESEVYLEIVNPAFDGTRDRIRVDVWAEVDPLPSASPETQPVEPLPPGTRLAIYWPADFTATNGDTPVILGARGEEVARDGTRIDQEFTNRTGYFTCGSRDAIWVLDHPPG